MSWEMVYMVQGKKPSTTKSLWFVPVGIFCCALLVRLIFLVENRNVPFFNYRGIDAQQYHEMAVGFLDGTWPGKQAFSWPPLYPLFLGLLYKIVGQNATIVKMLQAMMGAMSCVLVYFIARTVFNGRFVPIAAAIICCLCGTLIYFDAQLLSVNLDVLLELLIIFFLLFASRHRQIIWWGVAGLFIGLSAINRGAILLFLPIILFWMYVAPRYHWGIEGEYGKTAFCRKTIALLLPVGLVIFPVVLHNVRYDRAVVDREPQPIRLNQFVSTGFLPIASNLGINFYLGNHWELRKINNINHPEHFIYFHRINDEPAEKGIESAFGQSSYLVRQTLIYIFEKPDDFIKLLGLKVFQLFNGAEIPRNANLYAFRQYSVVLSLLLWKKLIAFPSGLIIPLGLVGIFSSRCFWRKHFLLLGCLLMQYLFIMAFFVTARYRLPTIPLLAIYAAFALETFISYAGQGAKRKLTVPIILLAALLLFCNSLPGKIETKHGYSEHGNVGNVLLEQGNIEEAILHYKEALKLAPDYTEANVRLANALSKKGEISQAVIYYKKALQHSTDCYRRLYNPLVKQHRTACYEVHRYLADDLVKLGKNNEAVEHYITSLDLNPDQPEVHYNLANVLMGQDKLDEAVAHYNDALLLKPNYLEAHSNLAKALAKQGRLKEAINHWQQLVQLNPQEAVLHGNLGTAYRLLGQLDKAVLHWEEALRLKPDYVSVLNKLAWLFATCENPNYRDAGRAVELAERGCKLTAYKEPKLLDTLAAAYAEAGKFDEAVRMAESAAELAKLSGQEQLAADIDNRLKLYRQKQVYHEVGNQKTEVND
jgi:tetratricopeptide (TPR) repeat protein